MRSIAYKIRTTNDIVHLYINMTAHNNNTTQHNTTTWQYRKSELQRMYDAKRMDEVLIPSSGKMVLLDKLLPKLKREGHKVRLLPFFHFTPSFLLCSFLSLSLCLFVSSYPIHPNFFSISFPFLSHFIPIFYLFSAFSVFTLSFLYLFSPFSFLPNFLSCPSDIFLSSGVDIFSLFFLSSFLPLSLLILFFLFFLFYSVFLSYLNLFFSSSPTSKSYSSSFITRSLFPYSIYLYPIFPLSFLTISFFPAPFFFLLPLFSIFRC